MDHVTENKMTGTLIYRTSPCYFCFHIRFNFCHTTVIIILIMNAYYVYNILLKILWINLNLYKSRSFDINLSLYVHTKVIGTIV